MGLCLYIHLKYSASRRIGCWNWPWRVLAVAGLVKLIGFLLGLSKYLSLTILTSSGSSWLKSLRAQSISSSRTWSLIEHSWAVLSSCSQGSKPFANDWHEKMANTKRTVKIANMLKRQRVITSALKTKKTEL